MLRIYYDLLSQPSRALVLLLKLNNVPFQSQPVALRRFEHKSEEFLRVNPFGAVPVMDDDGFVLTESVAILRHICRNNFGVHEKWYPSQPRIRAKVDEYMEWQHANTRMNCAMFFQTKWLIPTVTGVPPKPGAVEKRMEAMERTLDHIEQVWLKDRKFIATTEAPSVADILALCELEQPAIAGVDVFAGRKVLAEWGKLVKQHFAPHYDEVSSVLYKLRDKFKGQPASKL